MSHRKPTAIKRLTGNPGHRALNDDDLKVPSVSVLSIPNFLTAKAKTEFRRLMKGTGKTPGLLASCDRNVVALFCQAGARWQEAETHLEIEGMMRESKGHREVTMLPSYWLKVSKDSAELMLRAAAALGFGPTFRGNIHFIDVPKQAGPDPLTPPRSFVPTKARTRKADPPDPIVEVQPEPVVEVQPDPVPVVPLDIEPVVSLVISGSEPTGTQPVVVQGQGEAVAEAPVKKKIVDPFLTRFP